VTGATQIGLIVLL